MDEEIERAIKTLTGKIVQSIQPDFALKYTQSALNLAHVLSVLDGVSEDRRQKGSGA